MTHVLIIEVRFCCIMEWRSVNGWLVSVLYNIYIYIYICCTSAFVLLPVLHNSKFRNPCRSMLAVIYVWRRLAIVYRQFPRALIWVWIAWHYANVHAISFCKNDFHNLLLFHNIGLAPPEYAQLIASSFANAVGRLDSGLDCPSACLNSYYLVKRILEGITNPKPYEIRMGMKQKRNRSDHPLSSHAL